MRLAIAVVVAACGGGPPVVVAPVGPGEFPDNPQLVHIPADTPYAFATFKPLSPEYWQRLQPMMAPVLERMRTQEAAQPPHPVVAALRDELGGYDPARFAQLGLSTSARMVLFGLGPYPVLRFDIADRTLVEATIGRIAQRVGHPLPAVAERAGVRYWVVDAAAMQLVIGLDRTTAILAFVPPALVRTQLGLILGDVRPPTPLTTAWFRDYARREGFTGQGVGFIDLRRVEQLAIGALPAVPTGCRGAVDRVAQRVPRIGFGYDDLSRHMMAFSFVIELAPEVLAAARTIAGSLPGLSRLERVRPILAMALAADLERAQTFAPTIAAQLHELGEQCGAASLESAATTIEDLGRRPLPAVLQGVRGALLALTHLERDDRGTHYEGFGVIQVDDPTRVLGLAHSLVPDFLAPELDGSPTPLPAALDVPGHVAARPTSIAVALGRDSAHDVADLLAEPPTPAPLLLFSYDYPRFVAMMRTLGTADPSTAALAKVLGRSSFAVDLDDRGLVVSFSAELR